MFPPIAHRPIVKRRGVYVALLALTLLVVVAAVSLAINRVWVNAAHSELRAGTEAAALGAAGELIGEDLLRGPFAPEDAEHRVHAARERGMHIAARNRVAGRPLVLPEDAFRFGVWTTDPETNAPRFVETDANPQVVRVIGSRTRSGRNPVGMWLAGLSGTGGANVVVGVEVTIGNHAVAIRPTADRPIPMLPFAVFSHDPTGQRFDTWAAQIDSGLGQDRFGFDPESGQVTNGPDGLPELLVTCPSPNDEDHEPNGFLLDIDSELAEDRVIDQLAYGLTAKNLSHLDGEFPVGRPTTHRFAAPLSPGYVTAFKEILGNQRMLPLYTGIESSTDANGEPNLRVSDVVAVRILAVHPLRNGGLQLIMQPTVMTSRSIVLAGHRADDPPVAAANRYLYKLYLSR